MKTEIFCASFTPRNPGPLKDHTLDSDSGHYVFMISLGKPDMGKRARLRSETLGATGSDSTCFTFWYSMSMGATGESQEAIW
jgi:hypothetical protein